MLVVVTGGGGFIGSNLTDALLEAGHSVRIIDNFSTGRAEFLSHLSGLESCAILRGDLLDQEFVKNAMFGVDAVVHLAANADVRFGWKHPRRDVEQNIVATQNVLEAMRECSVGRLLFSSTGSVYGESAIIPTPEDAPYPVQTSLYGASKNAAEGLIAAYASAGYVNATVFRFVSILGPRYTHGHIIDFVGQLKRDSSRLRVLGDGTQRKSYLHVSDCVEAVMMRLNFSPQFETLNLGVDDFCSVENSIGWITERMGLNPTIEYSGGDRGWIGDNPFIYLRTEAMQSFGWKPKFTIRQAVESTVDWIIAHPWVLSLAVDS